MNNIAVGAKVDKDPCVAVAYFSLSDLAIFMKLVNVNETKISPSWKWEDFLLCNNLTLSRRNFLSQEAYLSAKKDCQRSNWIVDCYFKMVLLDTEFTTLDYLLDNDGDICDVLAAYHSNPDFLEKDTDIIDKTKFTVVENT